MTRSDTRRMRPVAVLTAAVAALLTLAVAPETAQAQSAARVESQTRPHFGLLLDPPTRNRHYRPRRHDGPRHGYGYGPGYDRLHQGREDIVMVECGYDSTPDALERAVWRLRPGGTLLIRARGGTCTGSLNLDKPIVIIGDGAFDPRAWAERRAPMIQAPAGQPCIVAAPGVDVEIRDVTFGSENGGAPCLVGYGGGFRLERVGLRHGGQDPAIYMEGGRLDIAATLIDARTTTAAVILDRAALEMRETVIEGARSGVEITPDGAAPSRITTSTFIGGPQGEGYGPRPIGVSVASNGGFGRVDISQSVICGFVEAVVIEGATGVINDSRLCMADKGVVLYGGELDLRGSKINVSGAGVLAESGRASVFNNVFGGLRQVIVANRATVEAGGNRVHSAAICRPYFRHRWQDRYEPYWPNQAWWECGQGSFPREPRDNGRGLDGYPYERDYWSLEGYNDFRQGWGWYDRDGRYVRDREFQGDARWQDPPRRRRGWFGR